jgi:hypothetical protein
LEELKLKRELMSTRPKKPTKTPESKKENNASRTGKPASSHPASSSIDHILSLQKTVGNQAVQKLIKFEGARAKFKIGPFPARY